MKKRNFIIIALICIILFDSCEEKDDGPQMKGEVMLSSEILGSNVYYVNGYSFEEAKYVPSMNSGSDVPDVIPVNILAISGEVIGMLLSAGPGNNFGFFKNFESDNISEAETFFSEYMEVNSESFSSLSDTLRPGQVYTFQTYKDNFVKILVEDVRLINGSDSRGFVETDIKYNIQRDGSAVFSE